MLIATLNQQQQRILSIIDYIQAHFVHVNDALTFQDISRDLSIAKQTVQNDLDTMNESRLVIDYDSRSDSFTLEDIKFSLDIIYMETIYDSNSAKLIELSFNNQEYSFKDAADHLGMSSSSMSRLLKAINQIIKRDFNIEINPNSMRFEGSEHQIRYFLYLYYKEKSFYQWWPFELDDSVPNLDELIPFLQTDTTDAMGQDLFLTLMINHQRHHQGYLLPEENFALSESNQQLFYKLYDALFNQTLSVCNIYDLTYPFCQIDSLTSDQETKIKHLINQIVKQFSIVPPNLDYIVNQSCIILVNHPLCTYVKRVFIDKDQIINHFYQKYFPAFFNFCNQQIQDSFSQLLGEPLYNSDLIFSLFINNWKDLLVHLISAYPKLKILIISNYSQSLSLWLKGLLKYELINILDIDIYSHHHIENPLLNKYDIVISQVKHHNFNHPHLVYMGPIPKIEDYQYLELLIIKLFTRNTQEFPTSERI